MKTLLDEKDVSFGTVVIAINNGKARGKDDFYKVGDIATVTHWFTDGTFGTNISTNILEKGDFSLHYTYEIY